MTNTSEINPAYFSQDRQAVASIQSKRDDLARAKEISPALVPRLEAEITACEQALDRARSAAVDHERERIAAERAELLRAAAVAELNTSHEVEPEAASRIVHAAEVAKYTSSAYRRRTDAAHSAATSAYFRASKDLQERNAAVTFAERLAGAVVDRDETRVPAETRPAVLAWLPLVLSVEGRAAYAKSYDFRADHPSYERPPSVEEYEAACQRVLGNIEHMRAQAAKQAADLAELVHP